MEKIEKKINWDKVAGFQKLVKEFSEKLELLNQCYPGDEDSYSIIMLASSPNKDEDTEQSHQITAGRGINFIAMLMGMFGGNPKMFSIVKAAIDKYPEVALLHAMMSDNPKEELDKLKSLLDELRPHK